MNDLNDLTVSQRAHETHMWPADGHLLPTDQQCYVNQGPHVGGHLLTVSQNTYETQLDAADGHLLPTDQERAVNHKRSVGGHPLTVSHNKVDTHVDAADGHLLPTDHPRPVNQDKIVGGHPLTVSQMRYETQGRFADGHLLPTDQDHLVNHSGSVGGHPPVVPPSPPGTSRSTPGQPVNDGWAELRVCGDLFARAQAERIAVSNLLRTSDHDMFGPILASLEESEKLCKLALRRCYRRVVPASLRNLQKVEKGLGEDSFARILGHLGDPYIATPHWWEGTGSSRVLMQGEPHIRTISQLWHYCGHGRPGRVAKGATAAELAALGNPTLKMLVHLQAEWCMKQNGRYRELYTATREAAEDKVHSVPCVRCGPSGRPALEGTPWSKGHQHAHALRIVGKEILRDMWLARHNEEMAS